MELLRVQDLALDYRSHRGTVHALDGVSLSMAPGEMLGLVGQRDLAHRREHVAQRGRDRGARREEHAASLPQQLDALGLGRAG